MSWVGSLPRRVRRGAARILAAGLVLAARANRRRLTRVRFIAVTGSCGKSTTTALIAAVLGRCGPVRDGTVLGLNSIKRAALTVLGTTRGHRGCVVEISGHLPGSVARVSAFLRPDIAIVTRVGDDHYSSFRSRTATAAEKARLVEALSEGGIAILNTDDPHVWAMRTRTSAALVGCGEAAEAELRLLSVHAAWPDRLTLRLAHAGDTLTVRSRLVGANGAFPILAALAVAIAEKIPLPEAQGAIAAVEPLTGRMSAHEVAGVTIIDDSRKAPLYTLAATLEFMRTARAKRRILVLGTLSDFGGNAGRTYRALAREAMAAADVVAFVGPRAASVERLCAELGADRLLTFANVAALNRHLQSLLQPGDLLMLKGSGRADHLERILLDRTTAIACWRERCGRWDRCETCRLLLQPG